MKGCVFKEAIKLCPDEYFVLEKYGSHPRYTQNLKESKRMLERAIDLRDTAFSRHHLALTLKKMVEVANRNQKYRQKLQNSVFLVRRYQSKDHSYDSGISSLPKSSLRFPSPQNRMAIIGNPMNPIHNINQILIPMHVYIKDLNRLVQSDSMR